jgi:hypothetical protein
VTIGEGGAPRIVTTKQTGLTKFAEIWPYMPRQSSMQPGVPTTRIGQRKNQIGRVTILARFGDSSTRYSIVFEDCTREGERWRQHAEGAGPVGIFAGRRIDGGDRAGDFLNGLEHATAHFFAAGRSTCANAVLPRSQRQIRKVVGLSTHFCLHRVSFSCWRNGGLGGCHA